MNAVKYIVVFGNPVDGFNFRGPFDDHDLASEYADASEPNEYWWIAELDPPYEPEISEQPKEANDFSEKTS
jgi:hypothetical protein